MMTLAELAARLQEECPGIGPQESLKRINRSIKQNNEAHRWRHLLKRASLQTEADYATGTVEATNGATAIVGTGTTWVAGWSTAPSSRKIIIQGRPEAYDVTVTGAGTATLGEAWLGDTDSGLTYAMFRDVYPLPTDFDYGKLVKIFDLTNGCFLTYLNPVDFYIRKARMQASVGIPDSFTIIGLTSETPPRPQLELGFNAPDSVIGYRIWYYKRTSFLTVSGAYPEWPEQFEDMLWLRAAIEHGENAKHLYKSVPVWKEKYAHLYFDMKQTMDGDPALDQESRSVELGYRRGSFASGTVDFNYRVL